MATKQEVIDKWRTILLKDYGKNITYSGNVIAEFISDVKNIEINEPKMTICEIDKDNQKTLKPKCDIPGCHRNAPMNDIFCSKHR